MALFKVTNYKIMITNLTKGSLKSIVSEHSLNEFLSNRQSIEKKLGELIGSRSENYGMEVDLIETQRVTLPKEMERAMAAVAETEKRSQALVINA